MREEEKLLHTAAARSIRYLRELPERGVAPEGDAIIGLERFDEHLPDGPSDPEKVIALLDEVGSPATMATAGPRFFGFVIGGSLPVTVAANWLATAWDQNAGAFTRLAGGGHARAGRAALAARPASACRETTVAGFVTGATMANFTALAAARHAVLARGRAGTSTSSGLVGAPPITVVVGDEVHPSLLKALGLLGLGRRAGGAGAGRRPGARCAPTRCRPSPGPPSSACRPAT